MKMSDRWKRSGRRVTLADLERQREEAKAAEATRSAEMRFRVKGSGTVGNKYRGTELIEKCPNCPQ